MLSTLSDGWKMNQVGFGKQREGLCDVTLSYATLPMAAGEYWITVLLQQL